MNVISADDHVIEPPDLWISRVDAKWGDRVPRVVDLGDGTERWVIDGTVKEEPRLAPTGALAKNRYEEPQRWADVPKEAYEPTARLNAMDRDGVDASVLYPTAAGIGGEGLGVIGDPELQIACVRAYNDWIIDTWAAASTRFVPQCVLPITSIEAATAEVERSLGKGHKGIVMAPFPWHVNTEVPHLHDEAWDSLWSTINEAEAPVCFHSGTSPRNMLELYEGWDPATSRAFETVRRPVSSAMVVSSFVLSRIGERFPTLKVVFAAAGINWLSFQLELSDHEWGASMLAKEGMELKPSELFQRQCHVTTWAEKAGMTQREFIGVDNILWQSEFPMETSTWPDSAGFIEKNFEGIPDDHRNKILSGNAKRLYKIDT